MTAYSPLEGGGITMRPPCITTDTSFSSAPVPPLPTHKDAPPKRRGGSSKKGEKDANQPDGASVDQAG